MIVSVIVPAFNAEKYLDECLESICGQTYGGIELIVVDDGSTDATKEIAQKYVNQAASGRVLSQQNKGVSAARNAGLSVATGDYVLFVDSDDVVDATLVAKTLTCARRRGAELTIFGFSEWYAGQGVSIEREMCEEPSLQRRTFALRDIPCLSVKLVTPNSVRMLYQRSFIEKNQLRFCEDLIAAEDLAFVYQALISAKKICLLNERLYSYRRDVPSSLTHNARGNCSLRALRLIRDYIKKVSPGDESLSIHFVNLVLDTARYSLESTSSYEEYSAYFQEFQNSWMPFVIEHEALINAAFIPFYETMKSATPTDYLFNLYLEEQMRGVNSFIASLSIGKQLEEAHARVRLGDKSTSSSELNQLGKAILALPSAVKRMIKK